MPPLSPPLATGVRLNPGDTLGGKYHIERIIGQGCMGVVMAARHIHLDERVAIKFMLPEVLNDSEHVGRFLREARAASRIKNEHVARVMDVDVMPGGQPYIVMEYLEGHDLGALLEANGPLPVAQAVDYVLEACNALAEAHALGIVHRDFKPANVFLARRQDGRTITKILDFGISKMKAGDVAVTSTVALMGSPAYMSPEQMMSSRDVDPRTDIWAVGVTLYQLLTGLLPFHGTTVPEVCARVLNLEPAPLAVSRPDVPPHLELVVLRCLVKNREQRFQSVADLVAALSPFGSGRSIVGSGPRESGPTGSHPSAVVRASFPQTAGGTVPVWEGTVSREAARRSRRVIIVAVTALGLVAAGLVTWALRGIPSETQRAGDTSSRVLAAPGDLLRPSPSEEPSAADTAKSAPDPSPIGNVAPGEPALADTSYPPSPNAEVLEPNANQAGAKAYEPAPAHASMAGDVVSPRERPGAKPAPFRPKPLPKKTALPSGEDLFSEPK